MAETLAQFRKRVRKAPLVMSGATGKGVREAMAKLLTEVDKRRPAPARRTGATTIPDRTDRMNGTPEARPMSERLVAARRIIVKIGSALLVDPASGRLKQPWLASLADDLKRLRARGQRHHRRDIGRNRARAPHPEASRRRAEARGKPGLGGGRADRAGPGLAARLSPRAA